MKEFILKLEGFLNKDSGIFKNNGVGMRMSTLMIMGFAAIVVLILTGILKLSGSTWSR